MLAAAGMLTSCSEHDYYADVVEACDYIPERWGFYDAWPSYQKTTLTPECKSALEATLPFDEASFALAPEGFKDKVMEAFQALVAFPLALPPDLGVLGARPPDAGAIPLAFLKIFKSDPNMNRGLFNYVAGSADALFYDAQPSSDHTAYYSISDGIRAITFYPDFWKPIHGDARYRLPFSDASVLLHEARHGDGGSHSACRTDDREFCDRDLSGPYGMNLIYPMLVAYGNVSQIRTNPAQWWSFGDQNSESACYHIQTAFLSVPPEVAATVEGRDCSADRSAQWYFDRLGIPWNPYLSSDP